MSDTSHARHHRQLWRQANIRIIPLAMAAIVGAGIAVYYGGIKAADLDVRLVSLGGVVLFALAAVACVHVATHTLRKVLRHYLGTSRAASIAFFIRVAGYIVILFAIMGLLRIPVSKLLLGGAVTGIVLGVAAQQSLANFFASIILLITRPYTVGERVILRSGALGGEYTGTIADIGLTHTKLKLDDEQLVLLPNASLLGGAAILPQPPEASVKK